MTSHPIYNFAGLRLRSPIALGTRLSTGSSFDMDVVVEQPRPLPFERPSTDVIAERRVDNIVHYTICQVPGGVTARFFGLGEFFISESMDKIVCHVAPGLETEYLSILLTGSIPAYLHAVQGRTVLHASAVGLDDGCIAFIGPSNQGKTTLAATLAAAGALLLTDDVLVLDLDPSGVVQARRGGCELRLRPGTETILDRFPLNTPRRPTVDQRTAVLAPPAAETRLALSAIVFPRPDLDATQVQARRLSLGEATLLLAANQRIEGWQHSAALVQQFQAVADVAERVPVLELSLPWGPPYDPDLPSQILDACALLRSHAPGLVV
jgi:hypothetical protein